MRRLIAGAMAAGVIVLVGIIIIAVVAVQGERSPGAVRATALDDSVRLNPDVRTGTLKNGLRYYVMPNDAPEGMAELRLVVDAGSVLEADDQRGLAHAVEHMAFRGTRRFAGSRMVDYLQSIGMRSGDDVNASTGFDETIYRLTVPTDEAQVLDTAFAILADWAHEVTFDSAQARQEAGVVFEEWRSTAVARQRLTDARDTLLLSGSRYAARFPIGDTLVLRRFDIHAMRRFYRDWYRPELMAVVAVGDFEADQIEALIGRHFGTVPASANRVTRPTMPVPFASTVRVALLSDVESNGTRVALWFPRKATTTRTVADVRVGLVERLSRAVLNTRLAIVSEESNAPLLAAVVSLRPLARPIEAQVVSGTVSEGRLADGLAALSAEVARLGRFGATTPELERAKDALLRDRREADAYGYYSSDIADALVRNFTEGDAVVSHETNYRLAKELLEGIGVSDVQRFAQRLSLDSGAAIVVTTEAGERRTRLTADSLLAVATQGAANAAEQFRDSVVTGALMDRLPEPGTIASERILSSVYTSDLTLGNGMRVLLRPTRFETEEVLLRITGPGGASLAAPADYASAYMADDVLGATGVGSLNGARLDRYLEGSSVSLSPIVSDYWVQLSGSSTPRDIDRLFQLAHLYFTATRIDTTAFDRYRERQRTFARNREADPESAFDDTVAVAVGPRRTRVVPGTRDFAQAVDVREAVGFWRARAANASNFTVVLVGDFSLERARPLVARYLASLPAGQVEKARDLASSQPIGVVQRSFNRGIEPKARTQIVLRGTVDLTSAVNSELGAVRDLLELVLEARLRESMGGTYGVSVGLDIQPVARSMYTFRIDFTAAPERVDSLARVAVEEIDRLSKTGPMSAEVDKVKAAMTRDISGGLESNRYWASELTFHGVLGWPLETIVTHRDEAAGLTTAGMALMCRRFLDTQRYVRVTMRPSAKVEPR